MANLKRGSKIVKSKSLTSKAAANIAGYEKRLAKKGKQPASHDVYEYVQGKARRSKVGLDLDREEALEYGVGLDGANDEDDEPENMRARLIGENEDDEQVASDDDEEIDSDAAFEESDEERFAGFFSKKAKKKVPSSKRKASVRFADVDLDEDEDMDQGSKSDDEDEEEEGDDDEFIDLLDVLDGKGEVDMGSDTEDTPKLPSQPPREADEDFSADEEHGSRKSDREDDSEGGSGSDVASEDEKMEVEFSGDEDEDSPEALEELQNFVSKLDPTSSKKRKAPGDGDSSVGTDTRARKRRLVKERTEAGAEDEFHARAAGSKLNLDDLLAPLASQSSTLLSLKKSTKILASASSSKAKTLSAPLPHRIQERLDREAAYEQTKEEVDKWSGTMKRIREAEHLSFPLQAQPTGRVSNLELAAKFKPSTALESSIDTLLKSAKLREEDLPETEETMLKANKLSVEEVAERRGELRKMRELMFRAEIKARRVNKIKSKTYRKIRRKEKERLGEKIDEEEEEGEEGQMKRELERARERATLRHKHTGKWAKQMRAKEGLDVEGRKEIEDMLARGEKLRRRIQGVGSDESEGDDDDDDDDDEEHIEGMVEKIKAGAFDELRKMESDHNEIELDEGKKGKSVFEMKFMKDAMARGQQAANRVVDDFIKEMGGTVAAAEDSDEEQQEEQEDIDPTSGVVSQRIGGRVVYRPGATNNRQHPTRPLGSLSSDTSSVTLKSTDLISPPASPRPNKRSPLTEQLAESDEVNPWLVPRESSRVKAPRKANEIVVGKDSKALDKSKNKLKKKAQKREEEREKAKEDAVLEISMDNVLTLSSIPVSSASSKPTPIPKEKKQKKEVLNNKDVAVDGDDDDSDANSEIEAQEMTLELKGKGKANGVKAFQQRDLVALAFAGDNVVQEFEEVKRREVASDAPREVDTTIPGWGSWGGTGLRKVPPKPQRIKQIAGIDPTTRADYNKKHIIVSEKRDKKAGKYLVKDLPFPFTSKAQFERSMERPLGAEWNTRVGFQKGTLPRVMKKPGVIINPLEKLI